MKVVDEKIWEDFKMLDELDHFATYQLHKCFKWRMVDSFQNTKYDEQKAREHKNHVSNAREV